MKMKHLTITALIISSFGLSILNAGELAQENTKIDSERKKIEKKEVSEVDKIKKMFTNVKASGELRAVYAAAPATGGAYATAIGGIIKYELAEYRGFNAATAVYTAYKTPFASGDGVKFNDEITSSQGNHTDMSEAYLNYRYDDLNIRIGRQVLDTPLADADDIRMIKNTFEAYTIKYENDGLNMMLGYINNWHGTDAGLDNGWVNAGDKGTHFAGIAYSEGLEFDAWYYNFSSSLIPIENIGNNSAYVDIGVEYHVNDEILLHMMAQYLYQSEIDNSGIEATIIGALVEVVVSNIGFNLAINQSYKHKGKSSFTGIGGGALFTNLDTIGLDVISADRDSRAIVAGVSYEYKNFGCTYAYGDFSGDEDSIGDNEHIIEQDIGASYNLNDEFVVGLIYSLYDDKENLAQDWNRGQVILNYNF
jgi:hypothetical protein